MRLALVISELPAGGAQRAISVLANRLAAGGRQVTLITLAARNSDSFRLHPGIRRVGLGLRRSSRNPIDALGNNWRAGGRCGRPGRTWS